MPNRKKQVIPLTNEKIKKHTADLTLTVEETLLNAKRKISYSVS